MFRIFASIFIILHGLVHLWYVVLSRGLVAVKPEMGWSGSSWLFTPLLGSSGARTLAGAGYVVATSAFVLAGTGFLARAGWARPLLAGAALLSSTLVVLFWEGGFHLWMEKGLIGLLINAVLLVGLWFVFNA